MSDAMNYRIVGDDMQMVEIRLEPQAAVRAEAGALMYMENGIEMETGTGGGLLKGLKRMISGAGFFVTVFLNRSQTPKSVAFAAPYPGKIVPLTLSSLGGEMLCQRDAFLCADPTIEIEVAFTRRLGAGLFGGEGFILQRLSGSGLAFVHAGGTIVEKQLQAGESLRVDTGCLLAFAPSVDYDIQFVGGFKNTLFGGEGLFLAKLTGPGLVYLQTLPLSRLADRITAAARVPNEERGVLGGGLLGGFLNDNQE